MMIEWSSTVLLDPHLALLGGAGNERLPLRVRLLDHFDRRGRI
jgi:hypothetical protein